MRHMKKIVISLVAMLMVLTTVLTLTACSSISTGFATQEELAKAYLEMEKNNITKNVDGNVLSFNDMLKFYDLSETPKFYLDFTRDLYEIEIAKLKAEIALKKAGDFETSNIDADGSFKKLSKEDYEKELNDVKKTVDSYVFIEAKKDDDLTELAQRPNKTIEVWVIKYEYYEYIDDVKADEKTEDEIVLSIIKINGKWFLNESFFDN